MHVYGPLAITIPSLKVNHEVIRILRSLFTNNPPSPGKGGHTTGLCVPSRRAVIWKKAISFSKLPFCIPLPTHNNIKLM